MAFMSFFQLLVGPEAVRSSRKVRWLTSLRQPYHHWLPFPTSGGGGNSDAATLDSRSSQKLADYAILGRYGVRIDKHNCVRSEPGAQAKFPLREQRQTAFILL